MTAGITLTIEKLIYGGDGLARVPENDVYPDKAGAVVFVPKSTPGDTVQAELTFDKKPFRALSMAVYTPSKNRVEPKCSIFDTCGGCDWQHIDTETQREWKQRIVGETLQRIGKFNDINILPIASANEWHYRNKAQWRLLEDGKLAYLEEDSHQTVAFEQCHIIDPTLQRVAEALQEKTAQAFLTKHPITKITARCNSEQKVLLMFHLSKRETIQTTAIAALGNALEAQGVSLSGILQECDDHVKCIYGSAYFTETLQTSEASEHSFQVNAQSFFQVNTQTAGKMLQAAHQFISQLNLGKDATLLDLYGGVGTFAIGLSDSFSHIALVESSKTALNDAKANMAKNNIPSFEIIPGQVEQVLDSLSNLSPSVTLLDPPRKGCHHTVLASVAELTQDAILYFSCDPTTLARDLKQLCALGWKLDDAQPIDMFPQTYHIETLALLIRDNANASPAQPEPSTAEPSPQA